MYHIRNFTLLLLSLLFFNCETHEENPIPKLIKYPVPFYERCEKCTDAFYVGIQTNRFRLIKNKDGVWLLYDKLVDPSQRNNLANLDEYIFIQLNLEKQLQELLENTNNTYILGGLDNNSTWSY